MFSLNLFETIFRYLLSTMFFKESLRVIASKSGTKTFKEDVSCLEIDKFARIIELFSATIPGVLRRLSVAPLHTAVAFVNFFKKRVNMSDGCRVLSLFGLSDTPVLRELRTKSVHRVVCTAFHFYRLRKARHQVDHAFRHVLVDSVRLLFFVTVAFFLHLFMLFPVHIVMWR